MCLLVMQLENEAVAAVITKSVIHKNATISNEHVIASEINTLKKNNTWEE